jgi:hypothetical protein
MFVLLGGILTAEAAEEFALRKKQERVNFMLSDPPRILTRYSLCAKNYGENLRECFFILAYSN